MKFKQKPFIHVRKILDYIPPEGNLLVILLKKIQIS